MPATTAELLERESPLLTASDRLTESPTDRLSDQPPCLLSEREPLSWRETAYPSARPTVLASPTDLPSVTASLSVVPSDTCLLTDLPLVTDLLTVSVTVVERLTVRPSVQDSLLVCVRLRPTDRLAVSASERLLETPLVSASLEDSFLAGDVQEQGPDGNDAAYDGNGDGIADRDQADSIGDRAGLAILGFWAQGVLAFEKRLHGVHCRAGPLLAHRILNDQVGTAVAAKDQPVNNSAICELCVGRAV